MISLQKQLLKYFNLKLDNSQPSPLQLRLGIITEVEVKGSMAVML